MVEGPHTVAAIVLETVVGTNGILVPPDGYLAGVRELCDEHGIVMICDEVMAGFGRCGEWFAVDHWGVTPDLICFAKGVNSGYVPLGGVVISRAHRRRRSATGRSPAASRTPGHVLGLRGGGGVASSIFKEEGIIEHARTLGTDVHRPRAARPCRSAIRRVGDVRGLGVFWALELVKDRATREPLVPYNAAGEANQPMVELGGGVQGQGPVAVHPLQPACTWCRRSRSRPTRSATAWPSSTRPSTSPTAPPPPDPA